MNYVKKISNYKGLLLVGMGIILSFLFACEADPDRPFSKAERVHLDTVFRHIKDDLRIELDSICKAQYDSIFVVKVDSIKEKRMEEIKSILDQ